MTFYHDLTPYEHKVSEVRPGTLNVGWLERGQTFSKGRVRKLFLERLWELCRCPVVLTRGFHECDLCESRQWGPLEVYFRKEVIKVGSGELRVPGRRGKIYAAPDMIFHYVLQHRYRPPDEFVAAVCACPSLESKAFARFLTRHALLDNSFKRRLSWLEEGGEERIAPN